MANVDALAGVLLSILEREVRVQWELQDVRKFLKEALLKSGLELRVPPDDSQRFTRKVRRD